MGDRRATDGAGADLKAGERNRGARRGNWLVLAAVLCLFPSLILGTLDLFQGSARKRAAAESAIFAAESSDAVIARLGEPMTPGWPIRGWLQSRDGEGRARLTIRLNGPKGSGRLEETAAQHEKLWRACSAVFVAGDGERITLRLPGSLRCAGIKSEQGKP